MSPVNAQTDFGDALDDTWDEKTDWLFKQNRLPAL